MGISSDFVKGFFIMIIALSFFLVLEFVFMKQIAPAILLLIGLTIPLSMIALQYMKNRKKTETNHN
jgi:uncharacterized membrane protein